MNALPATAKPGNVKRMSERSTRERDHGLMRAYLRDDPEAFAGIYSAYSDAIYGYLVKRVRKESERDDLFQKIWLKFHRARAQWSPDYPLLQWLFVIARSVLLDGLRSQRRTPYGAMVEDSELALERIAAPESWEVDSAGEEAALTEEMVRGGLSEEQVEVVRSRVFAEEEYAEIAERLGKNAVSVRKIFSRAIERIRIARVEGEER